MTIVFTTGNILADRSQALVNTVNCVGVMGAGLALQVKARWPENFALYQRTCQQNLLLPGGVLTCELDGDAPRFVLNLATKDDWRDPSHLNWIKDGCNNLVRTIRRNQITSVAIPPLGCGLGALDWAVVRPLLERTAQFLPDCAITIYGPR